MENFITILSAILGSGAAAAAVSAFIYRKQNHALKNDEVQKATISSDQMQIDLGDMFLEKTQKWVEIMENNSAKMIQKMDENNAKRDEDWRMMKEDMDYVKTEVKSISEYLNGGYQEFKKNGKKKSSYNRK